MSEPQRRRSQLALISSKRVRNVVVTVCFLVVFRLYAKSIVRNTAIILFDTQTKELVGDPDRAGGRIRADSSFELVPDAWSRTKAPFYNEIRIDTSIQPDTSDNSGTTERKKSNRDLTFYILPSPDIATTLHNSFNRTKSDLLAMASEYYNNALDEESAEIWLHKGFERLPARITENPKEADVYMVVGYCHLFSGLLSDERHRPRNQQQRRLHRKGGRRDGESSKKTLLKSSLSRSRSWSEMVQSLYRNVVVDATKPHLILIPTWNPEVSRRIGLPSIVRAIQLRGVADSNLFSVGFERSQNWQPVPLVSHILPIPYVVSHAGRQNHSREFVVEKSQNNTRKENSIFYVGDPRRNAKEWAGCSRDNIVDALNKQLASESSDIDMYLRLVDKKNRLNRTFYRRLVRSSDYCLVLCGDTPSSRTLTEAIVEGCIPIRVGSRLRGLCDPPCHQGFGWEITGPNNPHLPFDDRIPWDIFPEIDEGALLNVTNGASGVNEAPNKSLSGLKSLFQTYGTVEKERLRAVMNEVRPGFIYGYGDPVLSHDIGDAASFIWKTFSAILQKKSQ